MFIYQKFEYFFNQIFLNQLSNFIKTWIYAHTDPDSATLGLDYKHKLDNLRHVHGNVHWIAGGLDALHGRAVGHQLLSLGVVPASITDNN